LVGFTLPVLLLCSAASLHAQTSPSPSPTPTVSTVPSTPSLEKEFFKNILRDQKAIWTAPLHLGRGDAKWIVPTSIGTMALITTDRITGDEIAESDRPVKASLFVSRAGSVYGLGAVSATFYLIGRKKNDARARETGLLSAEALVNSLIVGSALKTITQRARPKAGVERSEFFDGGTSFPSGHSTQAWSVATVIANEYHDRPVVKLAAYGVATAVSVSRFTGQKHYLSDVLVGSLLGYGIGQYVFHAHHRKDPNTISVINDSRWPMIEPRYNRRAREYGVGLRWSF
jgi:hypothetical protein